MDKIKIADNAFVYPMPMVIVGAYCEERFMTDGKPDIKKIDPFTLTMPNNQYWKCGEFAGKTWSAGMKLKK